LASKVESGGGAKASTRCPEENPEEQKPKRGSGVVEANCRGVKPRIATWSKALKARSPELESRGNSRQETVGNDTRARIVDEASRLGGGNKPLKGESRTW